MNARWLAFENDVKMYGLDGNEDFILQIRSCKLVDRIKGIENLEDSFDVHAGALETAYMNEEFPQLTNTELAGLQSPTMLKGELTEGEQSIFAKRYHKFRYIQSN